MTTMSVRSILYHFIILATLIWLIHFMTGVALASYFLGNVSLDYLTVNLCASALAFMFASLYKELWTKFQLICYDIASKLEKGEIDSVYFIDEENRKDEDNDR